jgi:phage-related protein
MIQKYLVEKWQVYICLLCGTKLGEIRIDGYLASHHDCSHYYWKPAVGKESKKLKRQCLIKGKRDNVKYYLLSNVD